MTRAAALLAVLLLLVSCGDDGSGEKDDRPRISGRVTSQDGAASLEPPEGWVVVAESLDGPVVLAISDRDEVEQVFVSSFGKPGDAENAAIFGATTAVRQGATCKRLPKDRTFDRSRLLIDCSWAGDDPFHKVFVVERDGRRSALLLLQAEGETLAETAELITPILRSWRWQ